MISAISFIDFVQPCAVVRERVLNCVIRWGGPRGHCLFYLNISNNVHLVTLNRPAACGMQETNEMPEINRLKHYGKTKRVTCEFVSRSYCRDSVLVAVMCRPSAYCRQSQRQLLRSSRSSDLPLRSFWRAEFEGSSHTLIT